MNKRLNTGNEAGLNGLKPVTVTELTARIRQILERKFSGIQVLGEVSRLTRHASGHLYFTIKDANAALSAVIWRSAYARLSLPPEEGKQFIFSGYISVYEPRGAYQLIVTSIRVAGEGALAAEFERRKRLFAGRGWFSAGRKRPLPAYPRRIGIITSPTAAALEDVRKVLATRPGWLELVLSPCLVQGTQAAAEIVRAIERFEALPERQRPDVLLLVRGGGSIEDLWCFNEEAVVEAIVNSSIPVICGIGHEIDTTLADLTADVRAATPSNAAELVCPDRETLKRGLPRLGVLYTLVKGRIAYAGKQLAEHRQSMNHVWGLTLSQRHMAVERASSQGTAAFHQSLTTHRRGLRLLGQRLARQQPLARMTQRQKRLAAIHQHLFDAAFRRRDHLASRAGKLTASLNALSPYHVLSRGYALITGPREQIISSAAQLQVDEQAHLRFRDGKAAARVLSVTQTRMQEDQ